MMRYPSASNAMDTEVRMLRSSSTSAMIGISPSFGWLVEKCGPVPLLQRAKQDRNETAGRRMQGLTISNWPRLDEALASNSMNSRHLTCKKAREQRQEAQQRSTLSLQDEPRRPTVTRRSVEPAGSRQLRDFLDMRDRGACSRSLGQ